MSQDEKDVDHSQVFWQCKKLKCYWAFVCKGLKEILGYELPKRGEVLYLFYLLESNIPNKDQPSCGKGVR